MPPHTNHMRQRSIRGLKKGNNSNSSSSSSKQARQEPAAVHTQARLVLKQAWIPPTMQLETQKPTQTCVSQHGRQQQQHRLLN
mmetsp:Transcript_25986/g.50897  ORF Transcript_25986/g.50897 Transcript_25986/m.50897 type:complete len:83 (+) Transcript_25986:411-659(+)